MRSTKPGPQLYIVVSILLMLLASGCSGPERTGVEYGDIDTSKDPVQVVYNSDKSIPVNIKDGSFSIRPVAEYKASAKVVGKESYSYGWSGKLAPMDLALAWGRLAETESERYITYSQSDRWYFFQYKPDTPFPPSYIISHSSNNHIIPATENILKALKSVGVREKIMLEGFLVNLKGSYKGQPVWWDTSLSRDDAGNHSCELFYVTKVRVGNEVYE